MSLRRLITYLAVLFALSVTAIVLLRRFANPAQGTFEFELAKSLLQIATASVVGAVVSVLTAEYQRERTKAEQSRERTRQKLERQQERDRRIAENRDEFLKGILDEIGGSYILAKKTRRLLRAAAFPPLASDGHVVDARIKVTDYDAHLRVLNDVQLELETIVRDIETNQKAFSKASEVSDAVHAMEKYLNRVVKEYERSRGRFSETAEIRVADLERLSDFVRSGRNEFLSEFVEGRRRIEAAIRADLLHPHFLTSLPPRLFAAPPNETLQLAERPSAPRKASDPGGPLRS
jgi:hypothetical protein